MKPISSLPCGELEVGGGGVVQGGGEGGVVGDEAAFGGGEELMGERGDLGEGLAFGRDGGGAADGDDLAAGLATRLLDLAQGVCGDAVGGREDEDLVGAEADRVDGVGVDEVDVVAGGEDGGHQLAG